MVRSYYIPSCRAFLNWDAEIEIVIAIAAIAMMRGHLCFWNPFPMEEILKLSQTQMKGNYELRFLFFLICFFFFLFYAFFDDYLVNSLPTLD